MCSDRIVRVFFKGGDYMDCRTCDAYYYTMDPEWDRTEEITEEEDGGDTSDSAE